MPTHYRLPAVLLTILGLLATACDKTCDNDAVPQWPLETERHAWTDQFAPGTEWRFRNAAGRERTYRVEKRSIDMVGHNTKSSLCPAYYREAVDVQILRTDSADRASYRFVMQAAAPAAIYFDANISWDGGYFWLPIGDVETNGTVLPDRTIGGRTYRHVLDVNGPAPTNPALSPRQPVRLSITKTDGIVRFEEYNGTVWERL